MQSITVEKMFSINNETILKQLEPILGHYNIISPWRKLESDIYRLELPVSASHIPKRALNRAIKLYKFDLGIKTEQVLEFTLNTTIEIFHDSHTIGITLENYHSKVNDIESVYASKTISISPSDTFIIKKIAELKAHIHNSIYLILEENE